MKLYFLILAAFLFSGFKENKTSDEFKVIKVYGTIVVRDTHKLLVPGDILTNLEGLEFKTTQSKAALINKDKRRFTVEPDNRDLAIAKTKLIPAMPNVSSRAGFKTEPASPEDFFSGNIFLLDAAAFKLNLSKYPTSDNRFFFIGFQHKGQELRIKLPVSSDSVSITRSMIYNFEGMNIPESPSLLINLNYYNGEQSIFISNFILETPPVNELKQEVEILLSWLEGMSNYNKRTEVYDYITEQYGKTDMGNLNRWLKKEFGI